MPDFVRGANGSVIGIALDGHPDDAPDADPTSMIPIVPIPEHAVIGELPDAVAQADALGAANDRVAALEAQLAQMQADAANAAAAQVPADPNAPSSSSSTGGAPSWEGLAGGTPGTPAPPAPAPDPNAPPAQ